VFKILGKKFKVSLGHLGKMIFGEGKFDRVLKILWKK